MPRRPWLPITTRAPSPSSRIFSSSRRLDSDLVAHHDGVLDGHCRGVCLERAVLRPEIDRFRVVRIEDDPPVLGDDGGTRDDVEDDEPGTEGLGERPGDPEGFLRRFVEIGRVNERLEYRHDGPPL